MNDSDSNKLVKVNIICSRGSIEDVYPALILANGAVMEGIEANIFFTFFGIDAIVKKRMNNLHSTSVGNPSLRLPNGMRMPTLLGALPGIEAITSRMMKRQMDKIDIPPVSEFIELIVAGGGKIYACKLAMDLFKFRKEDLCELVSGIITVGDFYSFAGGEGSQIIFI